MKKIIALIPARGGSKRIPKKNIRTVLGIPLLGLAIEQAKSSELIDEVYVSTDSPIIADVARTYGAIIPFMRPAELATDESTDFEVFDHFLNWYHQTYKSDPLMIVQIRATSPIRKVSDIDAAIKMMLDAKRFDSLRSVSAPHQTPFKIWFLKKNGRLSPVIKTRQKLFDMPGQKLPATFAQDGLIDIITPQTLRKYKNMSGEKILGYTSHLDAHDVDTPADLNKLGQRITLLPIFNKKQFLKGRLGIIQGRLSPSRTGELQCFPTSWKDEFELARKNEYGHIELIRDKIVNPLNPLWTWDKKIKHELIQISLDSAVPARMICDDYIMTCQWSNISNQQMKSLIDLLFIAHELNIDLIVYPLFESANISSSSRRKDFCKVFKLINSLAEVLRITICLESNLPVTVLKQLIHDNAFSSTKLCIDTGNLFNSKINSAKEILEAGDLVGHIHFKDRNSKGENVVFGEGEVKFDEVLQSLSKIRYNGFITFESARGDNPLTTAKKNREFIENKTRKFIT